MSPALGLVPGEELAALIQTNTPTAAARRASMGFFFPARAVSRPASPGADSTPSPVRAGPPSPTTLTPTKTEAAMYGERRGRLPVKNTFIHYATPARTVRVASPPATVPSSFAPKNSRDWLRTSGVLPEFPSPLRASACTPAVDMKTPMGDDVALPTPSTVGLDASMPMFPRRFQCAAPAMPFPQLAVPAFAAPQSTVVRLSDFINSPAGPCPQPQAHVPLHSIPATDASSVEGMTACHAAMATTTATAQASAAAVSASAQPAIGRWTQNYEPVALGIMPSVPPLPSHGHGMPGSGCSAFESAVLTAATAAAAAAGQTNSQDPVAMAAAAAAVATRMLQQRELSGCYEAAAMQCYYQPSDTIAASEPPRVSISVGHFPEPSASDTSLSAAAMPAAPAAAPPTPTTPRGSRQRRPSTPRRDTDSGIDAEPQVERVPSADAAAGAPGGGARRSRRRRGRHGRGGGGKAEASTSTAATTAAVTGLA
eukprot:CAMPEP_0170222244 /NCGR_PEP_ID=MMETSP0116_2-20130129/10816_1 /TAXON_ID=400756 /ORGANISM="Durinskia baltica, Strain CSIRO CS-38" /LENGTH=482 /DNA_ID=CAMNT_0010472935 /DNA_START=105 /DNA_END=1553 /DNA_ORIENTATION=+